MMKCKMLFQECTFTFTDVQSCYDNILKVTKLINNGKENQRQHRHIYWRIIIIIIIVVIIIRQLCKYDIR